MLKFTDMEGDTLDTLKDCKELMQFAEAVLAGEGYRIYTFSTGPKPPKRRKPVKKPTLLLVFYKLGEYGGRYVERKFLKTRRAGRLEELLEKCRRSEAGEDVEFNIDRFRLGIARIDVIVHTSSGGAKYMGTIDGTTGKKVGED